MIVALLTIYWLSGITLGYWLGIGSERSRQRQRRMMKTQRIPLLLRNSMLSASEPQLPDLSKWKRGGRR